uniref:[Fe-S]-binding protein n=1 Tax=Candidatus Methanomethylicus mesodigestus TaxID=1867258 RepID=A0A7C3EZL0_9CREN
MPKRLSVVDVDLCVGCQCCMFACNRRFGESGYSRTSIHVQSSGGFEHGFIVKVCRACADPPCVKVCPTGALTKRPGGGVILNYTKCIACANCVKGCTIGAIFWDDVMDKPTVCVYCGYCAGYCPYGVIKLEELEGGEA